MSINDNQTTTSIGVAQDQNLDANLADIADDLLNDPDLADPDESTTTFRFDNEVQEQILAAMLQNAEMLKLAAGVVSPNAFTVKYNKTLAKIAIEYWQKYSALPTQTVMAQEIKFLYKERKDQIPYLTHLKLSYDLPHELLPLKYLKDQIAVFAKAAAYQKALNKFANGLNEGKCDIDELHKGYCDEVQQIKALEVSEESLAGLDAIEFFESADAEQRECWLEGWLMSSSVHLFAGSKKIGKSTLVHSLIPALITGKPWFGKLATEPTHVVYLDYENPIDYVRDNLLSMMPREQWQDVRERFVVPKTLPGALTGEWLQQFLEHNGLIGKKVVIFVDSAYAAFNGLFVGLKRVWDNQGTDVRSALKPLEVIAREHKVSFVVIHHDNKNGDTAGNAQWEAAVDYVWHYTAKGDERRLNPKWGRWTGPKPAELVFTKPDARLLMSGTAKEVRQEKQAVENESELDRLLALIPEIALGEEQTEQNGAKQRDLFERLGISVGKCSDLVTLAVERGLIERVRVGTGSVQTRPYYLYRRAEL